MFKQLKNYLLHDVPPEQGDLLTSPRAYLRQLLFDDNPHRHHPHYSGSSSGYSSTYPTPRPSAAPSRSESYELSLDVVDDGHPGGLGNAKILRNILRHLPIHDLLRCRLVNLRWNAVSSSLLRTRLGYTKVRPSKMKSFTKLMESSFANPIGSYAIRIDLIMERHTQKFLHLFSMQITSLRVRLNITEIVDFARHLQNMRNLRHLHVIVFDDGGRLDSHFIWNNSYENVNVCDENGAWKMGLYLFPNVRSLQFENSEPSYQITPFYDRVVANIITACGNLRQLRFTAWNSPLGKIFTKFNVSEKPGILDTIQKCATAEEIVTLFFTTNLRFHQLALEVNSQVKFELLADVIHRCGDSLNELTILNEHIFEKFMLTSALRFLVKLRLNLWRGPVDFTDFARQFPALKMVSLNLSNLFEVEQQEIRELAKRTKPCTTVKTLTLTRLEAGVEEGLIDKLAMLFPNIKEFFVQVRNGKAVERIFAMYSGLSLLSVELNLNNLNEIEENMEQEETMTNQCFTGIPDEEIKVLQEKECGCPELEFPEETRSCWNIACLKNLSTLLLRVPNTVNNVTLMEGISRLENLQNLVLLPIYDEAEEPVRWCLRSIADNFPKLRTLVTSTEVEYDEDDVSYLMRKIPHVRHRRKP